METLPLDVLSHLLRNLEHKDLLSCRLVSRHLNETILTHFADNFVYHIDFTGIGLSKVPLAKRLKTNESDKLCKKLQVLCTCEKSHIKRVHLKHWEMFCDEHALAADILLYWKPYMVQLCKVLSSVTHLEMTDCQVCISVWHWFLRHCPIEKLHCEEVTILDHQFEKEFTDVIEYIWPEANLTENDSLNTLTEFHLKACHGVTDYTLYLIMPWLDNLRSLDLSYNDIYNVTVVTSYNLHNKLEDFWNIANNILLSMIYIHAMLKFGVPSLTNITVGPLPQKHVTEPEHLLSLDTPHEITLLETKRENLENQKQFVLEKLPQATVSTSGDTTTFRHENKVIHCKLVLEKSR